MGLCRDFGSQITQGCDHPMLPGTESCHCEKCGVVCKGQFQACPSVWAQGPRPVVLTRVPSEVVILEAAGRGYETNGHRQLEQAVPPAEVAPDDTEAGTEAPPVIDAAPATTPELPPEPTDNTGAEAFRWFQSTFDALRLEVEGLRGALAQEQAMVATLVESRHDQGGLDAETLRSLVDSVVHQAVRQAASEITTDLTAVVASLRRDIESVRRAQDEQVAALQSSVPAAPTDDAGLQAAMAAIADRTAAELDRRDSASRKAFRLTLREELEPLVEVVAESVAQSEFELKALGRKLDGIEDFGVTLSMAVADIAAAMAAPASPSDESTDTPVVRFRSWADGEQAINSDAPAASGASAPTSPMYRSLERAGMGKAKSAGHGTRVSLRRPTPES